MKTPFIVAINISRRELILSHVLE